ncbi:Fatty acid hydroxylase, partial [Danaus plexippus plexippus]
MPSRSNASLVSEDKYHPSLEIDTAGITFKKLNVKPVTKYNYNKADYNVVSEALARRDWPTILTEVPFDGLRQVFPPIPALVIASVLFLPIWCTLSYPWIKMAGGLI